MNHHKKTKPYFKLSLAALITIASLTLLTTANAARRGPAIHPPEPEDEMKQFAPEMHADMFMEMVKENDPEQFEYLNDLRQNDPEKFHSELNRVAQEYRSQLPSSPDGLSDKGRGPRRQARGPVGLRIQRLEEHLEEYINWLDENYPEEAKILENARQEEPESFRRRLRMSIERYGHIYKTSLEQPELAQLLKEDMELKQLRNEILEELPNAENTEKKWLQEQLQEVVNKRFDIIMQRKQFHYNMLKQKLEELQNELKMREQELSKLKQNKSQAVEERLSELLGESEKINWD